MNKRERQEETDNSLNPSKIYIVSNINSLERTPNQVLKFVIYKLQQKLQEAELQCQQRQQELTELHENLENSYLWKCLDCKLFWSDTDDHSWCRYCKKPICENCMPQHNCPEFICKICKKSLFDKEIIECYCSMLDTCKDCAKTCKNCERLFCRQECQKQHECKTFIEEKN